MVPLYTIFWESVCDELQQMLQILRLKCSSISVLLPAHIMEMNLIHLTWMHWLSSHSLGDTDRAIKKPKMKAIEANHVNHLHILRGSERWWNRNPFIGEIISRGVDGLLARLLHELVHIMSLHPKSLRSCLWTPGIKLHYIKVFNPI
jgi:hypothetical protein